MVGLSFRTEQEGHTFYGPITYLRMERAIILGFTFDKYTMNSTTKKIMSTGTSISFINLQSYDEIEMFIVKSEYKNIIE